MSDDRPEVECQNCCGNGQTIELNSGEDVICLACEGKGWREMTDEEVNDAAADTYSDMCEREPPVSLDEQHAAAWRLKRELKR